MPFNPYAEIGKQEAEAAAAATAPPAAPAEAPAEEEEPENFDWGKVLNNIVY